MKILLLEDDTLLAQSVIEELEDVGYDVSWAQESDKVLELTYATNFNLYLFDVNVPGISGFELLKSLRDAADTTPTIFMTSRNQIEDLKEGFSVGATDYIKKPFDLDELLIRIESKLPTKTVTNLSSTFTIDPQNYTINCKSKKEILAFKEFALLEYFILHKEQLIETNTIMDEFHESSISIATFRTYIKNLKRHIEGCAIIENVKGVGYRFKIL